jgi:hypothetical protein
MLKNEQSFRAHHTLSRSMACAIFLIASLAANTSSARSGGPTVLAKYKNGWWYPATVLGRTQNNLLPIRWASGSNAKLHPTKIRSLTWRRGSRVFCRPSKGKAYRRAVIHKIRTKHSVLVIRWDIGGRIQKRSFRHCRSKTVKVRRPANLPKQTRAPSAARAATTSAKSAKGKGPIIPVAAGGADLGVSALVISPEIAKKPILGQVMLFAGTKPPTGWMFCAGQSLPIAQHTTLFSIIRNRFGGNGRTTLKLPDLRPEEGQLKGKRYIIAVDGTYPRRK